MSAAWLLILLIIERRAPAISNAPNPAHATRMAPVHATMVMSISLVRMGSL